jgi:hypothetical protein
MCILSYKRIGLYVYVWRVFWFFYEFKELIEEIYRNYLERK